jgi:ParB-like chromosome segregation protein Spo0J
MSDNGITDDIPVLVVDTPDNMIKQIALIENYMRLNMCREDIANYSL